MTIRLKSLKNSPQTNFPSLRFLFSDKLLEEVKKAFKAKQYVDEIIIIPEIYLQRGNGYATLDQIKQLYQLDVIAQVSYDQMVNGRDNLLSLTYLTIVGAYIFQGSSFDVSTMVDLAVVDVESRSIQFRSAGTSGNKGKAAEMYLDSSTRKKQNKGFAQAMEQMQANLYLELDKFEKRLREKGPNEKIVVKHREGYTGGSVPLSLLLLLSLLTLVKFSARKRI